MKEPPPRKRGRKSRRAAAAADLVPDEPFEDVRARARQERAISNECFSCGVAVPQLARKCLEHVISAVCTPVSPPFGRPPAHCCPLRQVEPLREYNDHFETTLTGEARARARGCIARTSDLPPPADEEATIDLGQTVGFFRLLMDKDRSVLDLTAPVSGAQTYKFGTSHTSRTRGSAVNVELSADPATRKWVGIVDGHDLEVWRRARPRKARPLSRARALRSGAHHARHPPRHQRRHPPLLGTPVRV